MPPPNNPTNLSEDLTHLISSSTLLENGSRAPPNTPYDRSPRATRERRFRPLDRQIIEGSDRTSPSAFELSLPHVIDLRSLTYVGTVDENLICPICRVALVDPVDTDCDHTFCRTCIVEALSHNESCPIDRYPLSRQSSLSRSHKIVINQLDSLQVKCPRCDDPIPRSMLLNHLERYCKEALVRCPGKTCTEVVRRKMSDRGCLHYDSTCPDCQGVFLEVDMEDHREHFCRDRNKECEHCGAKILRCKEPEHAEECTDIIALCKWAEYGCQFESKRKDLHLHDDDCTFKLVGPMAEMLKREISSLRSEVRELTEKDQRQERRIKFLESGQISSDRPLDYSELSNQHLSNLPDSANAEPLDSANEYLLSLVEAQESKVGQLSAGMTELEARQTMMLFNETLPIKNELAEMRSTQQVISMHVRWLLNFRRQENQRRFGGGPSPGSNGGSEPGGSSSDSPLPRRLSDSMTRDIITKL
jgi:TNF receptor-associated factor 5